MPLIDAKREVRELNRTQETLLLEYREELDAAHRQQRKQLSGLEEEVKVLRAELRSKDERLEGARERCDELEERHSQAKQHSSQLQKRYERVEAENEALQRRLREMEQQHERRQSTSTTQSYEEINRSLRQELKQTKQSASLSSASRCCISLDGWRVSACCGSVRVLCSIGVY